MVMSTPCPLVGCSPHADIVTKATTARTIVADFFKVFKGCSFSPSLSLTITLLWNSYTRNVISAFATCHIGSKLPDIPRTGTGDRNASAPSGGVPVSTSKLSRLFLFSGFISYKKLYRKFLFLAKTSSITGTG
jgi:hypothetical protein